MHVSLLLVLIYVAYVGITLRAWSDSSGRVTVRRRLRRCSFARLGLPNELGQILLQLGLGLVLLIAGAKGFILGVEARLPSWRLPRCCCR